MLPRIEAMSAMQRLIFGMVQLQQEGKKVKPLAEYALTIVGEFELAEKHLLKLIIETENLTP